jgi:hypothetical protein
MQQKYKKRNTRFNRDEARMPASLGVPNPEGVVEEGEESLVVSANCFKNVTKKTPF